MLQSMESQSQTQLSNNTRLKNLFFSQFSMMAVVALSHTAFTRLRHSFLLGFPGGSEVKASAWNAGDPALIPESRRSPGEGNGNPLQYSCLENPMDGGAWKTAVHGVAESRTRLSDFTFTFHFHALEKEMATHSSVLAWRIPGMGEPGGLWCHTELDTTEVT